MPDFRDKMSSRGRDEEEGDDDLGSLAQKERAKQLKNARTIMFVVAVVLVLSMILDWVMVENEIDKAGLGAAERDRVYRIMYIVTGFYAGLTVMYVTFGFLVKQYPVPITIIGLVVFIALQAALMVFDETAWRKGIVIKVIVVVGLAKAIQAGIAYEAERKAASAGRSRRRDSDEEDDYDRRGRYDDDRDRRDEDDRGRRRRRDEDD
jgi:hypothetical protein